MKCYDIADLRRYYAEVFGALGADEAISSISAEGISYADLHGVDSHGAFNLARIYVGGVDSGAIEAGAHPVLVHETYASATIDGQRAFGFATMQLATDVAAARARTYGVGIAVARNSTHCGAMGSYARRAATQGFVALAATNTGTEGIVPRVGGVLPAIGTNAFAIAAPAGDQPQFCLDMSTAVVASSKVRLRGRRGEAIPPGWLEDSAGDPVTDASRFGDADVRLRFLGGTPEEGSFKGFGLAIALDLLCGLLGGAAVALSPVAASDAAGQGIGHFVLVIDPAAFGVDGSFASRLDDLLGALRSAEATVDGLATYPGAA